MSQKDQGVDRSRVPLVWIGFGSHSPADDRHSLTRWNFFIEISLNINACKNLSLITMQ